ncbi:MAG: c-type cytochrome [Flavobacteriales bacterium]|nr:c-type cytochrome [Flavobacteriales bacterium]MBP9078944.1 c-type cytochrome [Flavobacteriales bacterium]
MKQRTVMWVGVVAAWVALLGCRREVQAPADPCAASTTPLELALPTYFPALVIPADNPLTVQGVELGRRLYYDPLLSTHGPFQGMACASCHHQDKAFTVPTPGTGVLSHANLAWSTHFLWDGRVSGTLEDVMRFEVEEFFQVDVEVLRAHPEYPELFHRAMGTCSITEHDVAKALAQWMRRMISFNSRFDQYLRHEGTLSAQETSGMNLFLTEAGDCFHCHALPLMTDNAFHNIGLDSSFSGSGVGRFAITGDPADLGSFKTPTLRNIALTAPYMHDGRFQTLAEVLDFYSGGVHHSPSLDPIMTKPGTGITLGLTPQQKADLIAFLHTLTDEQFITDPALASPF